jgi:hypothetical protein
MIPGTSAFLSLVVPGLDPGIHPTSESLAKVMDCRVKPGNDEFQTPNPN